MSNYSKSFGLTFINNDHFFATVAIFQNIFNGGCRILWGLSYDRFGLRKCMITLGLITTVLTASLPLLPYLGQETGAAKAGYGLVMVVLYGTFPGIYPVVAPAVAEAFGPVHYKANFGLLLTQSLAYSATILIITQVYNIILQGHQTHHLTTTTHSRYPSSTLPWDTPACSSSLESSELPESSTTSSCPES